MHHIKARNVTQALGKGLIYLERNGLHQSSRNGPVLVAPTPVVTTYSEPLERVVVSPLRNANPFFHFMESLWMLAGRNDLAWPEKFNARFKEYSDDGRVLHGAYGHRWRNHFKFDQLVVVADELKRDPNSRRAVLQMWDPQAEWAANGFGDARDLPCNTACYFDMIDGRLNMTVTCRSNDIWWGAYGANAVHFSYLLEYMAAAVGRPVGVYRQFSNNYHLYPDNLPQQPLGTLADNAMDNDVYALDAKPFPLVKHSVESFDANLLLFFENPHEALYSEPIFSAVAVPMLESWEAMKAGNHGFALARAKDILAGDWRAACVEWLERRQAKKNAKIRQGVG